MSISNFIRNHRYPGVPLPGTAIFFVAMLLIAVLVSAAADMGRSQTRTDPHGAFSEETGYCLICHEIHGAPGEKLLTSVNESEVCFTCHNGTGSTYNTQAQFNIDPAVNAMHPTIVDLPFNNGTYSYTPNTTAGIAPPGPYACSTCHDPHGETGFVKHLKLNYVNDEYSPYPAPAPAPDSYAACWSCHDRERIMSDETLFSKHQDHIKTREASCSACHYSPHGVPYTELVNFNPGYVQPSGTNPGPIFTDLGTNRGSCTLQCHGKDHQNLGY